MAAIIFFFALLAAAASAAPSPGKIMGGTKLNITDVPYQVGVYYQKAHVCGGALLTLNTVISAAHCVREKVYAYFSIQAGSANRFSGGLHVAVEGVHVHPKYNPKTKTYDAVIFKIPFPFPRGPEINTIPISSHTPTESQDVFISGWGLLSEKGKSSNDLHGAFIKVMLKSYCNKKLPLSLTESMFCAGQPLGGVDACQGDSGGPAVSFQKKIPYLAGVISWGTGCGRPGVPGVYTDVSVLTDWIKSLI